MSTTGKRNLRLELVVFEQHSAHLLLDLHNLTSPELDRVCFVHYRNGHRRAFRG